MRIYWFFIWRNLNPYHPRMLSLCKDWLKLAQWFWRRGIFNFVNVLSLFSNYLPLEKGGTLGMNKLESPSPKDALCQVWLKLAQWFWRRRFLNFVNVFSLFRYYLPLEKDGPFMWTNLNFLNQRMFYAKFRWNWLNCTRKEYENVKSLLQRQRTTDKFT